MLTASYITYKFWDMKPEYQDAVVNETSLSIHSPHDYGALDAPRFMPAGAHYCCKYMTIPGHFPMPVSCER